MIKIDRPEWFYYFFLELVIGDCQFHLNIITAVVTSLFIKITYTTHTKYKYRNMNVS